MLYKFELDMADATGLDQAYRRDITSGICAAFMPFMSQGATVTLHYTRPDDTTVDRLDLSLANCTT